MIKVNNAEFTPLTGGRITYNGDTSGKYTCDAEITLNGDNIKPGDSFQMNHGDIASVVIEPITAKDLRWRFRDD